MDFAKFDKHEGMRRLIGGRWVLGPVMGVLCGIAAFWVLDHGPGLALFIAIVMGIGVPLALPARRRFAALERTGREGAGHAATLRAIDRRQARLRQTAVRLRGSPVGDRLERVTGIAESILGAADDPAADVRPQNLLAERLPIAEAIAARASRPGVQLRALDQAADLLAEIEAELARMLADPDTAADPGIDPFATAVLAALDDA